jgi:ATP-dependent 26S proteasome regulatory subunit
MSLEDPGAVSFAGIGGLGDQVRELREVIELPLMNPELFEVSLGFLSLFDIIISASADE